MLELAKEYPHYGFEKHKGYGTKAHYEMLEMHGLCAIHRRSCIHLAQEGK
jgi:ribonuclease HII